MFLTVNIKSLTLVKIWTWACVPLLSWLFENNIVIKNLFSVYKLDWVQDLHINFDRHIFKTSNTLLLKAAILENKR